MGVNLHVIALGNAGVWDVKTEKLHVLLYTVYIKNFILKMEYTMNAAYNDEHIKPLTEQLKVTCINNHVGHHVLWGLTITYKYTCGIPGINPVSVLLSFLYMFTSDYWSPSYMIIPVTSNLSSFRNTSIFISKLTKTNLNSLFHTHNRSRNLHHLLSSLWE